MSGLFPVVQDAHERFLRDLNIADGFESSFSFFLLFEHFHFSSNVATIEFGGNVFAESFDVFAGDDFTADSHLQRDFKLVAGDRAAESNE